MLNRSFSLSAQYPELRMDLLDRKGSCLQLAAMRNVNIILQHYNFSGKLTNRHSRDEGMGLVRTIFVIISCAIILENLLVLLAVLRCLRARRWVYSCIASITVSDLLAGIAYLSNLCLSGKKTFQLSPQLWFLREGILFIALAASTFSLLVTAIERYSAMVRPIAENEASKTLRLRGLIVFCWLLAFVIGLLPLLGWNCLCDFSSCSILLPLYSKNYILFSVVMFSIILLGIIGLYISIFQLVQASSKQTTSRHSRKRSLRLLKTVLMILGAFIICWSPLFALMLFDVFCETHSCRLLHSLDWTLALAMLNSGINPIIYSLRSVEVRRAVCSLLCCCCVRIGLCKPGNCLVIADINSGSSTESSLRYRESFRSPIAPIPRPRAPLSSNSSMMSNLPSL
ncbi:sphingosine 1-phosphate receptor 4 [Meleagris gallopavo]|uniref:sphingosine 1-phosphate receptor 4 n=1 Tax=Meleagris gallopavo TaxID=9103 RepID=UPI000549DF73|nr:sphingosine 1-phosphate receptor 4 [Meleagris gallopavo]XP_010723127.1 sphingosine 1-phosphate receptor 4 [Meleagris gallopavo]XP_031412971.1 sphingosine 1-phosphate receptor 4 [Meleagris gallopavo]